MNKILFALQLLLRWTIFFFLFFIWTRYYMRSLWAAILSSLVLTIICDLVINIFAKKSKRQKDLKLKEKEDAENMFLSLATSPRPVDFFYKLASLKHSESIQKPKCVIFGEPDDKSVIFPHMSFHDLNIDDIVGIISSKECVKAKHILIPCHSYDKDCLTFVTNFDNDIVLLDRFECYNLYKKLGVFPPLTKEYKKSKKLAFKGLVQFSFNKQRTKGYLFAAGVLVLSSIFIRLSLYYCIMASILLIFAFISHFELFVDKNRQQNNLI